LKFDDVKKKKEKHHKGKGPLLKEVLFIKNERLKNSPEPF